MQGMEWYEIIVLIVGAFGGITGVITLYNAKPNRTKIEVEVLNKVIERLDTELKNKADEFEDYKKAVNKRVDEVKKDVLKEREENARFRIAIYQAYRCRLPAKLDDCPVIAALQADSCDDCAVCGTETEGHA